MYRNSPPHPFVGKSLTKSFLAWLMLIAAVCVLVLALGVTQGCDKNTHSTEPVVSNQEAAPQVSGCIELPETLPQGVSVSDVTQSLKARNNVPFNLLVPAVLDELGTAYSPEEYWIDSSGVHWGNPKEMLAQAAQGSCYWANGFSLVGLFHLVYWLPYRPPSYDAYMYGFKIRADPYGTYGVLVQKRDLLWICGFNPICGLIGTHVCAK